MIRSQYSLGDEPLESVRDRCFTSIFSGLSLTYCYFYEAGKLKVKIVPAFPLYFQFSPVEFLVLMVLQDKDVKMTRLTVVFNKRKSLIIAAMVVIVGTLVYSKYQWLDKAAAQQHPTERGVWKNDNFFDVSIIRFCQQFSRKSRPFDELLGFISANNLLKCGLFSVVFWGLWFSNNTAQGDKRRMMVIQTLMGAFIAIIVGRLLVMGLPFRIRPLQNEALHLTLPYGVHSEILEGHSSFPSDHAILLCAMATGLFFISRRIGVLAFVYAFCLVIFPRIYLCYHYPTDIVVGMSIGIILGSIPFKSEWMQAQAAQIRQFSEKRPALFYPIFFLFTYQIANMFDDVRNGISFLAHLLHS